MSKYLGIGPFHMSSESEGQSPLSRNGHFRIPDLQAMFFFPRRETQILGNSSNRSCHPFSIHSYQFKAFRK